MGQELGTGYGYDKLDDAITALDPINEVWVLTSEGVSSKYNKYVWTRYGLWEKDWIYTPNII